MRQMPLAMAAAIAMPLLTTPLPANSAVSLEMSFEACLKLIRRTAAQIGRAPINIVETNDVRIVRFVNTDGSVLVSCSRPDRKAVITTNTDG